MNEPLISCICVTKNHSDLLSRAIRCFEAQTYPNKELVVLYEESNLRARDLLKKTALNPRIKILAAGNHATLGALRNYAIEKSQGDFFCQWDDDDWHNAYRLEFQYDILRNNCFPACITNQWILFDSQNDRTYISGKRLWEGSLLCRKDILRAKKYANVSRGEDTPVVEYLYDHQLLYVIGGMPHLYIYNYHGGNTFSRQHFNELFDDGALMPAAFSLEISRIMKLHYEPLKASGLLNALMLNELAK
jgi:glycosyltransferase involved in cell wall biosynthesis